MITRAQILQVLEGELNALEDRELEDNHANALHQVLLLLIDGLEKLEKGEVPSVLAPSKVKARGKRPATLWEGRLTAIVAVRVLRRAGYSAEKAIEIVANAYGAESGNASNDLPFDEDERGSPNSGHASGSGFQRCSREEG